jgi:DNA-binding transcriptional regulator YiaG
VSGCPMDQLDSLRAEVRESRDLPDRSRNARRRAAVSQGRLADAIPVSRTTLARWELGLAQPRPAQRRRWLELIQMLEQECAA